MKEYKKKWNGYTVGNVSWINDRRDHLSRQEYVNYIVDSDYTNILEIGAGEAIEAQAILQKRDDIKYNVLDVSETFLSHAKKVGLNCLQGDMHNTGCKDKEFDLVFLSSVLEHSPDIEATFKELKRISHRFYFVLFKWKFKTGNLVSVYVKNRKYFSTVFNIKQLLKLLRVYGDINELFICTVEGKRIPWEEYRRKCNVDFHRNGNYLSLVGDWK